MAKGFPYRFKDRAVNWFEAREYCWGLGSSLVEINSSLENEAIMDEIKKHTWHWEKKQFWLGLTDRKRRDSGWLIQREKSPGLSN